MCSNLLIKHWFAIASHHGNTNQLTQRTTSCFPGVKLTYLKAMQLFLLFLSLVQSALSSHNKKSARCLFKFVKLYQIIHSYIVIQIHCAIEFKVAISTCQMKALTRYETTQKQRWTVQAIGTHIIAWYSNITFPEHRCMDIHINMHTFSHTYTCF